ncbi:hypothetical protein [Sphingosinithalassobacter portus]|uniref:hypothetical protein n=1 Tax=Stakelama portus TaxID=2676234 RepID=UPI000D6E49EB|nr:hypothetical protein [Sphingosinithalassobacter portus]
MQPEAHDKLRHDAGVASAERGKVLLDGPNGVAVTMTPQAAVETGESLIAAAKLAAGQSIDDSNA